MRRFMICTPHPLLCRDEIEKNELCRARGLYGEGRGVYRNLVGKLEVKRPLGRHIRRWEDNIKADL
jgi:hypothetical protein